MKQVFLICAHKDMDQLNRLIGQLCDPDFLVYVHLDRKSALDPARLHPTARLVRERVAVRWGDVSQVESTLASMRQILPEAPDFDKLILLSAQDFPLLPNPLLKAELARMRGYELIETAPIAACACCDAPGICQTALSPTAARAGGPCHAIACARCCALPTHILACCVFAAACSRPTSCSSRRW